MTFKFNLRLAPGLLCAYRRCMMQNQNLGFRYDNAVHQGGGHERGMEAHQASRATHHTAGRNQREGREGAGNGKGGHTRSHHAELFQTAPNWPHTTSQCHDINCTPGPRVLQGCARPSQPVLGGHCSQALLSATRCRLWWLGPGPGTGAACAPGDDWAAEPPAARVNDSLAPAVAAAGDRRLDGGAGIGSPDTPLPLP